MNTTRQLEEKRLVGEASVRFIEDGMIVGLGTGSTAAFMLKALARKVSEGLNIVGVPSSVATENMAKELGIPLTTLDEVSRLDLTIDGADECDPEFRLIKGGGGALLREKILAYNSKRNIVIADSSKYVAQLGRFKLPVETIPFATKLIAAKLREWELAPVLRLIEGKPYRTDEQNYILDIDVFKTDNLEQLNIELLQIPGVVETGLFLQTADTMLLGHGNEVKTMRK